MHVPSKEPGWPRSLISDKGDLKKCCHAGDALLLFALGWFRRRKPPSAPDSFTAHPVPLSGFTSPNSRRMPPRPGRGVTGPPRPKSKLPGVALRRPLPELRGPGSGRCSNAPHRSSSGCTRKYSVIAAHPTATWFETRGVAALLTMRVSDLILRA